MNNSRHLSAEMIGLFADIRLLSLDVDGVLTDGMLALNDRGEEMRSFSVRDGYGIRQLQENGVIVALLSGRDSQLVNHRASELGIRWVLQGVADKQRGLRELCSRTGCAADRVAHMGDDVPDLPAMLFARLGLAPADAVPKVLDQADWVSNYGGGRGAVREVSDLIVNCRHRVGSDSH